MDKNNKPKEQPVPDALFLIGWIEMISPAFTLLIILFIVIGSDTSAWESKDTLWGLLFFALCIGKITVGVYLQQGSSVSRGLIILLSIARLFVFPLGTLWGGFNLYALMVHKEVNLFFEKAATAPSSQEDEI